MEINHRFDSKERQHYLFRHHYALKIKPRLLYVGKLDKKGGWREGAHSHDFCEIIYVADGHGTITVEKSVYKVRKGDIIIYNADLVHEEESSSTHPMALYFMGLGGLRLTDLPVNHLLPPDLDFIYPSGRYARRHHQGCARILSAVLCVVCGYLNRGLHPAGRRRGRL